MTDIQVFTYYVAGKWHDYLLDEYTNHPPKEYGYIKSLTAFKDAMGWTTDEDMFDDIRYWDAKFTDARGGENIVGDDEDLTALAKEIFKLVKEEE